MSFTTANWSTPQSFRLAAAEDVDGEHETVRFTFAPAGGGYGAEQNKTLAARALDNDERRPTVPSGTLWVPGKADRSTFR